MYTFVVKYCTDEYNKKEIFRLVGLCLLTNLIN